MPTRLENKPPRVHDLKIDFFKLLLYQIYNIGNLHALKFISQQGFCRKQPTTLIQGYHYLINASLFRCFFQRRIQRRKTMFFSEGALSSAARNKTNNLKPPLISSTTQ